MMKRNFFYLLLAFQTLFLFGSASGTLAQSVHKKDVMHQGQGPLAEIVSEIARPKTFRADRAELYKLVERYCKRSSYLEDKAMSLVLAEFQCDNKYGMRKIAIESVERSSASHLSYLEVQFGYSNYSFVKALVEARLGRPKTVLKNSVGWDYRADSRLNESGNPIIAVSRDRPRNVATLMIAVEQPDE